jgi:hypothetical protein
MDIERLVRGVFGLGAAYVVLVLLVNGYVGSSGLGTATELAVLGVSGLLGMVLFPLVVGATGLTVVRSFSEDASAASRRRDGDSAGAVPPRDESAGREGSGSDAGAPDDGDGRPEAVDTADAGPDRGADGDVLESSTMDGGEWEERFANVEDTTAELEGELREGDVAAAERRLARLEPALEDLSEAPDAERLASVERRVEDARNRVEGARAEAFDERLRELVSTREEAESALQSGDYGRAVDAAGSGLDACDAAAGRPGYGEFADASSVARARERLSALLEEAERKRDAVEAVEEHLDRAERGLRSNEHETVESALADAKATIEGLPQEGDGGRRATFRERVESLERTLERSRAEQRLYGLLGSIGASRSRVETLLEEGSYRRAERQSHAALATCDEASTLVERHGLDPDLADRVREERRRTSDLVEAAERGPGEDLEERLVAAEDAVRAGIDHRDADEYGAAVDAFETAADAYDDAVAVAEAYDLPQEWETRERRSMVREYVEVTSTEFDRHSRRVRNELERTLEEATDRLHRAEQYWEVGDGVTAREHLQEAIRHLDGATDLVRTDGASPALREEYDDIASRAEDLHLELPADDVGEHRHRDLVRALQVLATDIGESPRPSFVNAYGDYPADAYLEAFGSWQDALAAANLDPVDEAARKRRTYSRVEVLDALVELADRLGRPPSKGDMSEHGTMSASPVTSRFESWDTALELAGIVDEDGAFVPEDDRTSPVARDAGGGASSGGDGEPSAPEAPDDPGSGGTDTAAGPGDETTDILDSLVREFDFD